MDYQMKALALNTLSPLTIHIRGIDDWYTTFHVEIKKGGVLEGCCGNGKGPQQSIEDLWQKCVDGLQPGEYLVIDAYGPNRKAYKWNSFLWSPITEIK